MLSQHEIGKQAITNRDLLTEVVKIKKIFYNSGFASYDDCLDGKLHLIPSDDYLALLKKDFNKMVEHKMFYREQPDFDHIIERLISLEKQINDISGKVG